MTREEYKKMHNSEGISFMEGRSSKEFRTLVGETVIIEDWSRIKTKNGEAMVFIIKEDPEHYYFANSLLEDMLKNIDDIKKGLDRFKISEKPQGKKYYPVELL